jgi:hypothetical protein
MPLIANLIAVAAYTGARRKLLPAAVAKVRYAGLP